MLFGGAGFLGRHVAAALTGHDVVAPARSAVDLTAGPEAIAGLLRGADAIVNCAGVTTGPAAGLAAGNVVAVAHLLTAWERAEPGARLVHLGSAAEYGAAAPGRPVAETDEPEPVSAYGHSKLAGTALVAAAHRRGLPATVLRVFNPLGPGTPAALLPGRLVAGLRAAADGGPPATTGPLDGHRDFVDARDVAAAVRTAATARAPLPALLNVGSGRATALRDLAGLAAALAEQPPPAELGGGSARSAAVTWQQADLARVTAALGWRPRVPLAQSLRDMGLGVRAAVP
ncbi:hypothetical protein Sya03_17260 [Spirilliplanes yamanashiensis]|uniref:NAD-dependent epimerase/dehydratase domain-containing protein n=1 Tax=Spirilliplanes yamanashiensis TaxID=42233 RepID=A0A8J3Y6F0_9ACTN|nr:hypothetical protein Sya03_17260 [Spirilliplanes yamanashiensis]